LHALNISSGASPLRAASRGPERAISKF